MHKSYARQIFALAVLLFVAPVLAQNAAPATNKAPADLLLSCLLKVADVVEPPSGTPPQSLKTQFRIVKAEGGPMELAGSQGELACLAPDRLRLTVKVDGKTYALGRDGKELWITADKLALIGTPEKPRFSNQPDKQDGTRMKNFKLPLKREQLMLVPLLADIELRSPEKVGGVACQVLRVTPKPEAREMLKLPDMQLDFWIRESDFLPMRFGYSDRKEFAAVIEFSDAKLGGETSAAAWKLKADAGTHVEHVALSHVTKFLDTSLAGLSQKIPTLGPATGERKVVAVEGAGRLEEIDGTRVLFLKGTPEEMGRQQGVLLKPEIRNLVDRILYGVGVGSSFEKGVWFFGEIESAQKRLDPFISPRYYREMDAMAVASGVDREEIRLANFFPELFHCSGFSLSGAATEGGRMYHGRILDYLRGMGLEQNAVVIVNQPDEGNAWVNIGYAGFLGSITAMNEKHISIGEMGGRGEGNWDGKPMAQLVREVMEKANTLDEAVAIMRKGPRTCAYYYVIADGKTKTAVGIAATPETFEVIKPGESHPQLPNPSPDTVLMSAGSRYDELARRVKSGFGKFNADSARELMKRPVCMTSNIHSVLFEPETLDFWVANADEKNPAAHTRYTHYSLAELLKGPLADSAPTSGAGK